MRRVQLATGGPFLERYEYPGVAVQCLRLKPNTAAEKQMNVRRKRADPHRHCLRARGWTSPDSGAKWQTE